MRKALLIFGIGTVGFLASTQVLAHGLEESGEAKILAGMGACRSEEVQSARIECYVSLCETPDRVCVESLLETATELEGPRGGTATLHDIMTVQGRFGIRTDGHDLIHIVGRQAARHFGIDGDTFSQCSRDFFYGCEHGFFEVALAEAESPVTAANQVCGTREVGKKFVCYHGVGHGLMMAYGNDVSKAIKTCDEMPKDEWQDQGCWQGVFMENINAEMRGEARKGVFLESDPLAPCSRVDDRLARECYVNHAGHLMKVFQNSIRDGAAACLRAKTEVGREACMTSLGQFPTNPGWQAALTGQRHEGTAFFRAALELCGQFPEEYRDTCFTAGAGNLINYDDPERAVEFCDRVPQSAFRVCQEKILMEILRPIFPAERRGPICEKLVDDLRDKCRAQAPALRSSVSSEAKESGVFDRIFSVFQRIFRFLLSFIAAPEPALEPAAKPVLPAPRSAEPIVSMMEEQASDVVVRRIGEGFTPATFGVNKGETVTWVNDTDDYMWPASDVHPTHEEYPDFDARKPIKEGGSWSFTFKESGTWTFHDHLHPEALGTVTVR